MQMITTISIDLYGEVNYYLVSAKQGDRASRYVRVSLMNNGVEFEIPSDATVYANIKKPDGRFCYNECEVDNNKVIVELTNQALAAAGTAYCDIEIRRDGENEILSSAAFTIEIEESMRNENAILSSNEMTALDNRVQFYIDKILETESGIVDTANAYAVFQEAAVQSEAARVAAETARANAESARASAEVERANAETQRNQTFDQKTQAADAATENANAAAGNANNAAERAENAIQNSEQLAAAVTHVEELAAQVEEQYNAVENLAQDVQEAKAASEAATQNVNRLENTVNAFAGRTELLEAVVFNDFTDNPFLILFDDLNGISATGVWNSELQRIEC